MGDLSLRLALRLIALGVVAVIVQVAAISQVRILGANADITPLVVASAGFLCGSLLGAGFGFFLGLFLDVALVQTLGVSSLLFLTIGYGAGRLRELRDPQGALVPVALGAAATLVASVGFALIQFLLGVDVPLSFSLVLDLIVTVGVNSVLAAPLYAVVRWWLAPALPDDPRRRRRRAYTTGGLSPLSRA